MIEFLGLPTFFVTFSAADNHWPDLQHLMKRHEEGELLDDVQIDKSGRNGRVVRNPHMVGSFFGKRIQIFLEEVIKTENLAHHRYIFEYQHQGSIHTHGLLWMIDCPVQNAENVVKNGTEEQKHLLLDYYDSYVSAWNPSSLSQETLEDLLQNDSTNPQLANPTIVLPAPATHPCRTRYNDRRVCQLRVGRVILKEIL